MMAEPISISIGIDELPAPAAEPAALAVVPASDERLTAGQQDQLLTIAEHMAAKVDVQKAQIEKFERKRSLEISVRFSERAYPLEIQLKLYGLRQEVNNLNKAQRRSNELVKFLRHEVRLRDRVMRLKTEAADSGIAAGSRVDDEILKKHGY